MIAELIGVGDGKNQLKAGFKYIVKELEALGIQVRYQSIISDRASLHNVYHQAMGRSEIILTTNGAQLELDEMAKEEICSIVQARTDVDTAAYRRLNSFFQAHGKTVPGGYVAYAAVPEGAVVFPNNIGFACGWALPAQNHLLITLPGNPRELASMFYSYALPALAKLTKKHLKVRTLRVYGLAAKELELSLEDLLLSQQPNLSVYDEGMESVIRITGYAQSAEGAAQQCLPTLKTVVDRLSDYIYGLDVDGMPSVVSDKLLEKQLTVGIAESGTGGVLGKNLAEQTDANRTIGFLFSSLSTRAKVEKLGLSEKLLKKYGSVGGEITLYMASLARTKGNCAIGVAITTANAKVQSGGQPGMVYIAVCDDKNAWMKTLDLREYPEQEYSYRAALCAMNMIRLYLDYYPGVYKGAIPLEEALGAKNNVFALIAPGKIFSKQTKGDKDSVKKDTRGLATKTAKTDGPKKPWYKRVVDFLIPKKTDSKNEIIKKCVILLCAVIFLGSAGYLIKYSLDGVSNKSLYENIGDLLAEGANGNVKPSDGFPDDYLPKFAALWDINPDIVGFVEIPNSQVKYPVVQTTDNDFYLRRDFNKQSNQHGVIFMDYEVDVKTPSTNLILYGHNMNDGQMFGELMDYQNLEYYKSHPVITYDSVYEEGKYKIVGMFLASTLPEHEPNFHYQRFIDCDNEKEFDEYINDVKIRSFLNTGVDAKFGDELITLSTCGYVFQGNKLFKEARFALVARKVRDGESATVDTTHASINPNPLMPDAYYAQLKINKTRVSSVKITNGDQTLGIGDKFTVGLTFNPENALNKKVTFSSSDTKVATVTQTGEVVGVAEGTAVITVTSADNANAKSTVNVKVVKSVGKPVTGVSLDHSSLDIVLGEVGRLRATVQPEDAKNKGVIWSSADSKIASVDPDGNITAKAIGKTTVTVTTSDGGFTATARINVVKEGKLPTGLELDPTSMELGQGETGRIRYTVLPDTATNQNVTFTSSSKKIATVDADGYVTGESVGKATITVKTEEGGIEAICRVTVTDGKKVSSVELDTSDLKLSPGSSEKLQATLSPDGATYKSIAWKSSNTAVAKVMENGKSATVSVPSTAKDGQTATITVTVTNTDGSTHTASCKVTVGAGKVPVSSISISPGSLELVEGDTATLDVTIEPGNATDKAITWSVEKTTVASVSGKTVTAKKAGTTTITATCDGKTATISVTVTPKAGTSSKPESSSSSKPESSSSSKPESSSSSKPDSSSSAPDPVLPSSTPDPALPPKEENDPIKTPEA